MMLSMLEHCQKAHAMDLARRMGVPVKAIRFERGRAGESAGILREPPVLRVLVDAPQASPEQVRLLSDAVSRECPMAAVNSRTRSVDVRWVHEQQARPPPH
eukprot:RCo009233